VDVWLDLARRIERADAHEAQDVRGAAIIAPQRDLAIGTAPDLLTASLSDGVITGSGDPLSVSTSALSTRALITNALPVSVWHEVQWQQWTNIGSRLSR
jgi:hypothetical protein